MSGQQIGTVVGGLIGAYFGGPAGAQLGAAIGGYIGGVIDPTVIKGPSIGDAQQQTSLGGQPIPKFYGHCPPVAPTVVGGDAVARKIKVKSGGKGDTTQSEQEKFIATRAFLVGEGVAYPARITRNGKLVYSTQPDDDLDADSSSFAQKMTWYPGDESQGPDPSLEAIYGVGNTPYFRGRCYFVVRDDDETQTGGAANQYRIECISNGVQTTACSSIYGDAIAYWPLDDAARNGDARELIAGRNGKYSDTPGVAAAQPLRLGSIGSFNMTSREDCMIATFDGVFTTFNLTEWSTSAYCALNELEGTSGTQFKNVATYWQSAQFGYVDWSLGLSVDNQPFAQFSDGATVGHNLVSTAPHKIAWIVSTFKRDPVDPTQFIWTLYVDGINVQQIITPNAPGRIGAFMTVGGGFYPNSYGFLGAVSDVAMWDKALEPADIQNAYLTFDGHYPIPDLYHAVISESGLILNVCGTVVSAPTVQWKDIVSDIAGRANAQLPAHLDIDNMTDVVPGFVLGNATLTATDYIRTLCAFYTVDLPEYDDKLHAIRRGAAVVATLDPDDLLAVEDEDNDVRSPAVQTYQRVTVIYPDPENQYVPTPQTSPRTSPDVTANNAITIQCPIPFDHDTMAQKADILQKIAFLSVEGTFKRAFPAEYSKYVPSDPIIFNDRRHIITKASNDDCMVTFEGTYDRPSAYTSTAKGSRAPAPRKHTSNIRGPSLLVAMNSPSLRTADNVPGIYLGVGALRDAWEGADIYLSVDGGETEHLVKTILDEATMGVLNADCDAGATDLMQVRVFHKNEVSSVSDAQIAARANAFAVVTDDVAEIGQFKTATETATDGTYDLSDLTRGELGTDAAPHFAEDRFIMLDSAVTLLPVDIAYAGRTLIFRAVTRGTIPANNVTTTIVYRPQFTSVPAADFIQDEVGAVITAENGDYIQAG